MRNYVAQHQRDLISSLVERIQKAMECHHPSMAVTTRYGYITRTRTGQNAVKTHSNVYSLHYGPTIINT